MFPNYVNAEGPNLRLVLLYDNEELYLELSLGEGEVLFGGLIHPHQV